MKLNDRARQILTDQLDDGEQIVATIQLNATTSTGRTSDGVTSGGGTAWGTAYGQRIVTDIRDVRLRHELHTCWCTLTDKRLLFHSTSSPAFRPKPGKPKLTMSREGVELRWFVQDSFALKTRILHLVFPDDTFVLTSTWVGKMLGRNKQFDEADLFIAGFGDKATEVADS